MGILQTANRWHRFGTATPWHPPLHHLSKTSSFFSREIRRDPSNCSYPKVVRNEKSGTSASTHLQNKQALWNWVKKNEEKAGGLRFRENRDGAQQRVTELLQINEAAAFSELEKKQVDRHNRVDVTLRGVFLTHPKSREIRENSKFDVLLEVYSVI